MALNDIIVPRENASGTFDEITLPDATTSARGLLTSTDKTKLDGIAAGAEVNVNADWTASSGDAQILNKPTIPTASTTTPAALGTAAAGTASNFARADHVHALPNASALLSTGAGLGDLPVAQGDGTVAWQTGSAWAGDNLSPADIGAAAATHAASHASGGSDPLTPSAIGAQSIFATDSASAAVSGVPLQLSSARAKTWTLENVHSNRDVYLPVTGIQAGDVAVLIGGGNVTYTLTVKVPAAGGAAIIDPENTPSESPVVISATGQQYRFIVTNPASFNPWRFVSVDTHTHPASVISDSTTAGRALLTAADSAAQRTSLGLGTAATSASSAFAAASHSHELTALAATGATNGHVLTANGSGGVTFAAASGGGSGGTKTYAVFTATDNNPPATDFATIDQRNSIACLDFSDTATESAVFVGVMPEGAVLTSGLIVRLHWMGTAITGNVRWSVAFERGSTDLDADSFDTATAATATTSGTSGIVTVTAITCTNIDSIAAGDLFRLRVQRLGADAADTMTGAKGCELVAVEVRSAA